MPRAPTPNWFDTYRALGAPDDAVQAQQRALLPVVEGAVRLWRDPELGPLAAELLAREGFEPDYGGDVFSPEDAEEWGLTAEELPDALGAPELTSSDALHVLWRVTQTLGAADQIDDLPEHLAVMLAVDAVGGHDERKPRLLVVSKDFAIQFVLSRHSAFPKINTRGLLYALGVRQGGRVVAVATATTPTGAYKDARCPIDGIVELSRIASDGTVVGASSLLASRLIDLLPLSGRRGVPGCLFVTYSLIHEAGTTYLALVDKGLRPVGLTTKRAKASGARRGGDGRARPTERKVIWEAGPAAAPPDWSLLADKVTPDRLVGAQKAFAEYERRTAKDAARAKTRRSA